MMSVGPPGRERHDHGDGAGRIVRLGGGGRQRGHSVTDNAAMPASTMLAKLRSMCVSSRVLDADPRALGRAAKP